MNHDSLLYLSINRLLPLNNPLFVIALLLLGGSLLGLLAKKGHLPSITGQIFFGILIGKAGFDLIQFDQRFSAITEFALSLIALSIGNYLHVKKLRNAYQRIFTIIALEAFVVPVCVWGCLTVWGVDPIVSILLSIIAISTAPATTFAVIKETNSQGLFVKTLVSVVAINNVICVLFFEIARNYTCKLISGDTPLNPLSLIIHPFIIIGSNALLGSIIGIIILKIAQKIKTRSGLFIGLSVSILILCGLADSLKLSPLLSSMIMGFILSNFGPMNDELLDVFNEVEEAILILFFVIAGAHLDLKVFTIAGPVCLIYIISRFVGKYATLLISGNILHIPKAISNWLGLALIPQAGVAIGLVVIIEETTQYRYFSDMLTTIILASVVINEIIGPICTRFALYKSGEINQKKPKLIDFFKEEYIWINICCQTRDEMIQNMSEFFISTQQLPEMSKEDMIAMFIDRENQLSTCVGQGIMIPHIIVPKGDKVAGVIGISKNGLDYETPDGIPIHIIIMIAIPESKIDHHLEVLAAISRIFGRDAFVREQIIHAKHPSCVIEILNHGVNEQINYFL